MSTIELKELIVSRISQIDDETILNAISILLEDKSENLKNYNLELDKSEKDIISGNTYSHNQVLEKISEWKKR
ncbi:hypothetical protein [Flavobacterium sp.]|uniref:hypothetical protein n=1 Tax=Flavobacterium sp. TaxID=239 RepID=UPI0037535397